MQILMAMEQECAQITDCQPPESGIVVKIIVEYYEKRLT